MTASPEFDLTSVLRKIYIDPIQSIVIIDDEYKVLWNMQQNTSGDLQPLGEEPQSSEKISNEVDSVSTIAQKEDELYGESIGLNKDSYTTIETTKDIAQKIIASCKDNFILHVDNRHNTPDKIIEKADFLILDYFLTRDENPEHSIKILEKYIARDKFSPIIIHSSFEYEGILNEIQPKLKKITNYIGENYIYGDGFFIAILSKFEVSTIDQFFNIIIEKMNENPPSPLFMFAQSCIENISQRSQKISNSIFSNKATRAGVLYHIISQHINAECEDDQNKLRCKDLVERIFEDVGTEIRAHIEADAKQIFANISSYPTESKALLDYAKQKENSNDDDLDIMLQLNTHLCSHEHRLDHVTTGTILKKGQDYYLCTSPSCDCVPGRGEGRSCQRNKLSPANYFFACKLDRVTNAIKKLSIKDINYVNKSPLALAERGKHIFINHNGNIEVFQAINTANQPKPYIFYAPNGGYIDSKKQTIHLQFITFDTQDNKLALTTEKMQVIGQLRHLYASNLLQRFGMHNSRIGVDFKNYLPTVDIDDGENNA